MGLINLHKSIESSRKEYKEHTEKALMPIEKVLPDDACLVAYDHYDYFRMSIFLAEKGDASYEKLSIGTAVIEIDTRLKFSEDFKNELLERIKNVL